LRKKITSVYESKQLLLHLFAKASNFPKVFTRNVDKGFLEPLLLAYVSSYAALSPPISFTKSTPEAKLLTINAAGLLSIKRSYQFLWCPC